MPSKIKDVGLSNIFGVINSNKMANPNQIRAEILILSTL